MPEELNYYFIEEEVRYFLNVKFREYSELVSNYLLEDRIYPLHLPITDDSENIYDVNALVPAIVYQVESGNTPNAHTGSGAGVRQSTLTVVVKTNDYKTGAILSEMLINFADGYTGNMQGLEFQGVYAERNNDAFDRSPFQDDSGYWSFPFQFTVWWDYIP